LALDTKTATIQDGVNFFELLPGKMLDIEINHPVRVRIKLPLIGYSLGNYIILKYPREEIVGNYNDVLVAGNVVIARYLLEGDRGECFAFRSSIKNITKFPEKLLVLNYPKKIESRQLRLHQRIMTNLPAAITLINEDLAQEDVKLNGIIGDISTKGCGFTFKADTETTKVNKRDVFVCVFNIDGEDVKIPAKVCNSRNEQGKVNVGIQFNDGDEQVVALLERLFIIPNNL
jgi:ribosome biogenesis SPOUT family RNA methylase Rps3